MNRQVNPVWRSVIVFFAGVVVAFCLFLAVQARQIGDLREACERGNVTREQTLDFYDSIIHAARKRSMAWRRRPHDDPAFARADFQQVRANRAEARGIRQVELNTVAAQHEVSANPDALNIRLRAVVDCSKAYPLRILP